LNHHPNERDTILTTLQETNDQTRKLYRKITSDPRFTIAEKKSNSGNDEGQQIQKKEQLLVVE